MNPDDKHQLEKEQEAPGVSDKTIAEWREDIRKHPNADFMLNVEEFEGLLNRLARAEHARDMWRTAFHSIKQE